MRALEVLRNIFSAIGRFIKRMLPNPRDNEESKNFKTTLYFLIGCVIFMLFVSVVAFLAFVQPVDETVIPNMAGADFRDAVVILQNKKLEPYINFEFTNASQDKDLVIKHVPMAREKVRIGSRVTLWVSQGAAYDRVGNYVGKTLTEVENLFRSSFNRTREVIAVKKPVNYLSHNSPNGTIIAQSPAPGTPLGSHTLYVELTVSRGMVEVETAVGTYTGKHFERVIEELESANVSFVFIVKQAGVNDDPGTVATQNLAAGTKIEPGTFLVLEMFAPENLPENKLFGVYTYTIPDFGAPVLVKVESEVMGKRTPLLTQERFGGRLTLPYILDKDAEIYITLADEEKLPVKVRAY